MYSRSRMLMLAPTINLFQKKFKRIIDPIKVFTKCLVATVFRG